MKYVFDGKFIVARAETTSDNFALLAANVALESAEKKGNPVLGSVEKPKIKHRKHRFLKPCPECGELKKSVRGHMSWRHPAQYQSLYKTGLRDGVTVSPNPNMAIPMPTSGVTGYPHTSR